jgi:hypothetical protein
MDNLKEGIKTIIYEVLEERKHYAPNINTVWSEGEKTSIHNSFKDFTTTQAALHGRSQKEIISMIKIYLM